MNTNQTKTTKTETDMNAYINIDQIKQAYAPYNRFPAFEQGYNDYLAGKSQEMDGVDGQAYDRGQEAGMKVSRAADWIEQNVGAN